MLSRSAENLFWLARYIERAESTARLLEMGRRMAMLPGIPGLDDWRSVVQATGADSFLEKTVEVSEAYAVSLLMLNRDNPSSIRSSLVHARANAKSVRTALTQQMWETLNDGWRHLDTVDEEIACRDLASLIDWVITRAATFRGATDASMLRDDRYDFLRLGWLIECADNTLRLLDIKYYVLLPEKDVVGGGRDHHQWTSLLKAVSGTRAFHHLYNGDYSPWQIADFMILNRLFPRSVRFCYFRIVEHLNRLRDQYGALHACHDTARQIYQRLEDAETGTIFQSGLHEYIVEALAMNRRLSREIAEAYHFTG